MAAAYARAAGKQWRDLPPPRVLIAAGLQRGNSGLRIEDLESAPHGVDLGPLQPSLLRRLETASGCIECAPPLLLAELERRAASTTARADGALCLIGRRDIRSNNSWMHNAPRLIKGKPRHHLLMHPHDLSARGIAEGARVRVRSRTGSIETEVRASDAIMPGVACLPHGFGHGRDGMRIARAQNVIGESYNDLSDAQLLDAPSGNAALSGVPVWVEPIA
jgi:anaerobic selenocysteine-containing dehydrogenase